MYLEDLTAHVRGDNTLLSYSEPYKDGPQAENLRPFARAFPSSPYERAWSALFDEIWLDESASFLQTFTGGLLLLSWLESRVLPLLNTTVWNSTEKIMALETYLQTTTSFAYAFLVQQFRVSNNLTHVNSTVDVRGQQQITMAKLHVHASQTFLGLFFVIALFFCVLYTSETRTGLAPPQQRHIIVGDALDFVCLMRGSSLPGLFAEPMVDSSAPEARRDKAEKTNVR